MAKSPTPTASTSATSTPHWTVRPGAFSLAVRSAGDLKQIFLPRLKLEAGQGKAEGHLNLQFADGIAWDTALDLSALNPAYWVAELPGTLAGPLRSKGEIKNERSA
jgi:translocation and assembly module TamB